MATAPARREALPSAADRARSPPARRRNPSVAEAARSLLGAACRPAEEARSGAAEAAPREGGVSPSGPEGGAGGPSAARPDVSGAAASCFPAVLPLPALGGGRCLVPAPRHRAEAAATWCGDRRRLPSCAALPALLSSRTRRRGAAPMQAIKCVVVGDG